jgi:hypothetical protein
MTVAADAEIATVIAVSGQQTRQPCVIQFALGHIARQIYLISLLHAVVLPLTSIPCC